MPQTNYSLANATASGNSTSNTASTTQGGLTTNLASTLFTQTQQVATSGTSASSWFGTGVGTLTLPANYLKVGKQLRIKAAGAFVSAATPGTLTSSFALGSSTILTTGAATPDASVNANFALELVLTVQSVGSSGTCAVAGSLVYTSSSALKALYTGLLGSGIALNTTVSNTIAFTTTNSVSAGAVFTIDALSVEVLN